MIGLQISCPYHHPVTHLQLSQPARRQLPTDRQWLLKAALKHLQSYQNHVLLMIVVLQSLWSFLHLVVPWIRQYIWFEEFNWSISFLWYPVQQTCSICNCLLQRYFPTQCLHILVKFMASIRLISFGPVSHYVEIFCESLPYILPENGHILNFYHDLAPWWFLQRILISLFQYMFRCKSPSLGHKKLSVDAPWTSLCL